MILTDHLTRPNFIKITVLWFRYEKKGGSIKLVCVMPEVKLLLFYVLEVNIHRYLGESAIDGCPIPDHASSTSK